MIDIRSDLLALHMHRQSLTDHQLAAALAIRTDHVRAALSGLGWFGESVEHRLCLYLEVPKTEFERD